MGLLIAPANAGATAWTDRGWLQETSLDPKPCGSYVERALEQALQSLTSEAPTLSRAQGVQRNPPVTRSARVDS